MSLENEDPSLERGSESQRNTKISYTRDELLFFSNLCSKLPNGFDSSVLSELDETFIVLNERQRGSRVSIFQSSKNSDYSSLPQTRPNNAVSFYCGSSGKWDARSSESNIRDGDFQSNRETNIQEYARCVGKKSRFYAQHAEHDGLLGSRTYQRPSGYEEPAAAKCRAANQFQLNKTPECCQPPRPYKALTLQQKDNKDLCNDETFETNSYSNEDRREEWRRKESSELTRKEQQKALQEKQKQLPDNHKQNLDAGIVALLGSSADKKNIIAKADEEEVPSKSQIESFRVSKHAPLSRSLVPPGFASTPVDKILPAQSVSFASEAPIADTVNNVHLDSIWERVLGGSLQTSSSSATAAANQGFNMDEKPWVPSLSESSKFSSWSVKENKLFEDFSSQDSLSLIANKGKVGSSTSIVSHDKLFNHVESGSISSNDSRQKFDASPTTALMVEVSEQFHQIDKPDQNHVVLTCEELEQSILADLEGRSNLQHAVHGPGIVADDNMKHQKSDIDDDASQHLLSLLRKGAKKKEMTFGTGVDVEVLDKLSLTDKNSLSFLAMPDKNTTEIIFSSEKSMIPEALFRATFMNELQFAQAPVSTRRTVIDDESNIDAFPSTVELLFQKSDASFCSRSGNRLLNKFIHQIDIAPLSKAGSEEKILEFYLPDEDSLIIESDILEPVISDHLPFVKTSKNKEPVSQKNAEHLKDKLFTGTPRGDVRISVLDTTLQSPHDLDHACSLNHHLRGTKASHTISYTRSLHPLLQHLENVVPQTSSNHASTPGIGPTSYDTTSQQMSIPRNFQSQLPLPGFARGIQLPCQIIFLQGHLPKANNADNIPLQQQPNSGSFGIGNPGAVAGSGGNHTEAFQRLVELEMRAILKHPCPLAAGHIPSAYGPEFRYT